MIEFEDKFFEGEWRCDFYVQSEMKRYWAAQMEVLMEIDRICRKNEIQYFADGGTLLGAVRHKGFIPWDDDMDIAMKRDDYRKFHEIAKRELEKSDLILLSIYEECKWGQPFMRVINSRTIKCTEEHLKRFHGCPYSAGVDIFPLDYIPRDKTEKEVLLCILRQIYRLWGYLQKEDMEKERIEDLIREIESNCKIHFKREENMDKQILQLLNQCSGLYASDECDELMLASWWAMHDGNKFEYKKEWYEECILQPFENIMLPIPNNSDSVLRNMYGDYMIPIKDMTEHEYPVYKEQKELLQAANIVYTGDRYIKIPQD